MQYLVLNMGQAFLVLKEKYQLRKVKLIPLEKSTLLGLINTCSITFDNID
jgi:hypothetical protein